MGLKKIKTPKAVSPSHHEAKMQVHKGDHESFKVRIGGKEKSYTVARGFGYFVPSFRKATSLSEIATFVDKGIPSREIQSVIRYFNFTIPDIAKAASVSVSTVSRWEPETSIGTPGSGQFFRIDEVIRKGVALFGGEDELKQWLMAPNMALGNVLPSSLVISNPGIDLVDGAIDALAYGGVL